MKISKLYIAICGLMLAATSFSSCTDYLDKAEESDISPTEAYKDFQNFQGFTEEIYNCIPEFDCGYWTNSFNWGEDEILNVGIDYHMCYKVDQGDFWGWQSEYDGWGSGFMDCGAWDVTKNDDRFKHQSLWKGAWYGIRKANMGLENLDKMTDCTQEEKNLIAGQLYFFRGFFHFELIQYFGGLPYINRVLSPTEQFNMPRLSYQACADSIAKDLRKAADLLPVDWDKTQAGLATSGRNQLRITKIAALGYLGKNYLWAGSPLMNKESQNNPTYNKEYCQKAAEAFGELLSLVDGGKTQFGLIPFKEIQQNFTTINQNGRLPGQSKDGSIQEAILRGPNYEGGWGDSRWGQVTLYGTRLINDADMTCQPTANYVNYYGMANGLPLDDPDSGFDPTHPWKNRDPRFYQDIIFDGEKMIEAALTGDNANKEIYRYADLQTDGAYRKDSKDGNRTGYLLYKFISRACNKFDDGYGWSSQINMHLPWMRLADVYLMYAEAAAEANGTPVGKASNYDMTAVEAVNKIRERAGVEDVNSKYTGDLDKFMSEIRRERAVELSYEGHRFNDLRRWLLLDKYPYNIKTSQEFVRVGDIDKKHPENDAVSGWSQKQILKRDFSEKHYWLPLKKKDCQIYPEFKQNPGW